MYYFLIMLICFSIKGNLYFGIIILVYLMKCLKKILKYDNKIIDFFF